MHVLRIENFELFVNLGVEDSERAKPQKVYFTLEVTKSDGDLKCSTSDDIADAMFDYAALLDHVKKVEGNGYKLIEALGYSIYQLIRQQIRDRSIRISFEVQKYPQIEGLIGGAKYCYSD